MKIKEKELIIKLKSEGLGYKAIAARLNKPVATITSFIKRNKDLFNATPSTDRCLTCGKLLTHTPKHRKKKFCNDTCRMKWRNSHPDVIGKQEFLVTCKNCGKTINSIRYKARKFCSHSCYISYRFHKGDNHD